MNILSSMKPFIYGSAFLLMAGLTACGGDNGQAGEGWEAEHGYGPVNQTVELGETDAALAQQGQTIFTTYCTACHGMENRLSGPPLRPVIESRTPEFVMNYILNPTENRENHPIGQQLSEEYAMTMVNMNLDRDQARAIYEYFRYYDEHGENL